MIRVRTFLNVATSIRLFIALVLGLLLGMLASRLGASMQNVVPYLLFPLVVGVIGACTIRAQNPRPYLTALSTSLFAWLGIGVSLLISATQMASTPCTSTGCGNGASVLTALLIFYLLIGLLLVALSALITHMLVRRSRQTRDR